jgi:hypothetical protein
MNTYEHSPDPNEFWNRNLIYILIILFFLLVLCSLYSCSTKEQPVIEKEYTVSAVVYFENGNKDTISSTVLCTKFPCYNMFPIGKQHYSLHLDKGRSNYYIVATKVTHFKQIK